MLLEMGIADAYGADFEFCEPEFILEHNKLKYYANFGLTVVRKGAYTDDTQMSLSLAEALLENDPFTLETIAERFVSNFHRDPRRGYSGRLFLFLNEVKTGKEFLSRIDNNSDRAGACMRSSVLGLLSDINEIKEKCYTQASITHNTEDGKQTSFCSALMVYYFKNDIGPKEELKIWLEDTAKYAPIRQRWFGESVRNKGIDCVQAASDILCEETSLSEMIKRAVAYTGDVDTIATISTAAGVWNKEVVKDIPKVLYDGLENGTYGREYLEKMDKQLLEKFNTKQV